MTYQLPLEPQPPKLPPPPLKLLPPLDHPDEEEDEDQPELLQLPPPARPEVLIFVAMRLPKSVFGMKMRRTG